MSSQNKMNNKPTKSQIASKIPTSGRDSGTHSRSSSVSNLTTASDIHSEIGDATSDSFEDFKIDERIWVNGTKPGTIKFLGKTEFAPGVWAGIHLDEPVGKNDGSVAGVKYFTCVPQYGIFARPNKLTKTPGAVSAVGDSTLIGSVTPKFGSLVHSSRTSVCSNVSASSPKPCSRLRLGERITVSSLGGTKSGTLKFVGECDFAKGEWAGIALDEPTGKNDGSVAGKRYFTCQMKYGLFAPLHKVSRCGGTPISRAGSVKGTPLRRSSSRDSISSSISNSSRASRVKLGVTSLTGAQKTKVSGGGGITTTSKALQDALKEKEQHIEQLLQERDLDRAEFAKMTSHFEEMQTKSSELERIHKKAEADRKGLEGQLTGVQRKLEDIQFQLEEEKIAKSDFEMQLQQRSNMLKRIEEFISKESAEKFLNIKEILLGQESLSEISDTKVASSETEELKKKISDLESYLKHTSEEKESIFNQLSELQTNSGEVFRKNENLITMLNTTVQEKDDMILHLRNELNSYIEKVTQLIEENKNMNEQILLKEEEAKGHADDVIKELGEKINSLNGELKKKSTELNDYIASIQERDIKISTLEQSLSDQVSALSKLQNEHDNICSKFKEKERELQENEAAHKSLDETIVSLKCQVESDSDEKQKKIILLEEEIKAKSSQINECIASIQEKENAIASLQQNFDAQAVSLSKFQNELKELNDALKQKDLELQEKAAKQKSLEDQISVLQSDAETTVSEKEKKMLDLFKEIERATNCVQEKENQLSVAQKEVIASQADIEKLNKIVDQMTEKLQQADHSLSAANRGTEEKIESLQKEKSSLQQEKDQIKLMYEKELDSLKSDVKIKDEELDAKKRIIEQHESQIPFLSEKLNKSESECSSLRNEISTFTEKLGESLKENESLESSLKAKEELIADFTKQVDSLKISIDKNNQELGQKDQQIVLLQDSIKLKEEESNQLTSKLELSENKVEMLNKDSSEHVMTLQKELSKLKEEATSCRTHLEQELHVLQSKAKFKDQELEEKSMLLAQNNSQISVLSEKLNETESVCLSLKNDMLTITGKQNELLKEKELIESSLRAKDELIAELTTHVESMKISVEANKQGIEQKEKQILSLQESMQLKEEENNQLSSNLQQVEHKIEMLIKDSREHVMTLQSQLCKVEKESTSNSTELQQEIDALKDKAKATDEEIEGKNIIVAQYESQISLLSEKLSKSESECTSLKSEVSTFAEKLNMLLNEKEVSKSSLLEKEKELASLVSEVKVKENLMEENNLLVKQHETQIVLLGESLNKSETECLALRNEISTLEERQNMFSKERDGIESAQKAQEELIAALTDNVHSMKTSIEKNMKDLEQRDKQILSLQDSLKLKEEEKHQLTSKLQEVEQKAEMLNKDSGDNLMALQSELCNVKEEATTARAQLEQELEALRSKTSTKDEELKGKDILITQQTSQISLLNEKLSKTESDCASLKSEISTFADRQKELLNEKDSVESSLKAKEMLQTKVEELQKINDERLEAVKNLEKIKENFEEQLNNNKNSFQLKEKEVLSFKEQLLKLQDDKVLSDSFNLSLKSLEEENKSLKNKITLLELAKSESKVDAPATNKLLPEDTEGKECLLSQIDFLNSIIVDMKQKNEELTNELEMLRTCWDVESDVNLNDTKKAIAPRLFCDICEMFDLHDTGDCPKQESFVEEKVPHLRKPGSRNLEERPYCNDCEVFGHWTLDCHDQETY